MLWGTGLPLQARSRLIMVCPASSSNWAFSCGTGVCVQKEKGRKVAWGAGTCCRAGSESPPGFTPLCWSWKRGVLRPRSAVDAKGV